MAGSTQERFEVHECVATTPAFAVNLLEKASGLSRQDIKRAMQKGAVWITRGRNTQRLRRVKRVLQVGDELHLYYDAKILDEKAAEPQLISDVGDYSVWDKPYGLRSQGSKWGDHCTITRWAEQHLQPERPAFTVHRLDRAARGLILVAHSKNVAAALSQLFRNREIEKRYVAHVHGDFSAQPNPVRVHAELDGKSAVSEFSHLEFDGKKSQSLVNVRIETGRKHQIRRHLVGLGFPIVGDRLYGGAAADETDLQLTAYQLGFVCPVSKQAVSYSLSNENGFMAFGTIT